MADTKWLDPGDGWTLADWEDDELFVKFVHLWDTLKGKADELQAFVEAVHSGDFDEDREFPDFNNIISKFLSGTDSPNNAVKINTAVYPVDLIETDTIEPDDTAVTIDVIPNELSLSDLLTGPLSYASGTLLHMSDTNSGVDNAKALYAWLVQWYQVMNYPFYYERLLANGTYDYFDEIEYQFIEIDVGYSYDNGAPTAAGSARIKAPMLSSSFTDIYTSGDLNETPPFSTNQEVWDYATSKFNSEKSTQSWVSVNSVLDIPVVGVRQAAIMDVNSTGADNNIDCTIREFYRIRFKPKDSFRAASPDTFANIIRQYFYLDDDGVNTFNNFGAGIDQNKTRNSEITEAGDGYYYFNLEGADYSTFTVPGLPPPTSNTEVNDLFTLNADGTLGQLAPHVLFTPNQDDGSQFLWYTP